MPPQQAMWINDWDAGNAGLVVENVEGWADTPSALQRTTQLPQRVGTVPLAPTAETASREITVSGTVRAATSLAQLRSNLDNLKARLFNGCIEVRFADHPERMVLALCSQKSVVVSPPQFANLYSRISIRLLCPDPLIYTKLGSAVGFTATRAPVPLGSAISLPVLRIAGAVTNPTVTYYDFRGATKGSMGFTVALGATEYLEVDCELMTVTKYTAGAATNGLPLWTSGDFLKLDPQDADFENAAWPALAVSPTASCEVLYRKTWL